MKPLTDPGDIAGLIRQASGALRVYNRADPPSDLLDLFAAELEAGEWVRVWPA